MRKYILVTDVGEFLEEAKSLEMLKDAARDYINEYGDTMYVAEVLFNIIPQDPVYKEVK